MRVKYSGGSYGPSALEDATQVSDVGSVLFCLSEQNSELHLLDKVIVVLALVLRVGDPR